MESTVNGVKRNRKQREIEDGDCEIATDNRRAPKHTNTHTQRRVLGKMV